MTYAKLLTETRGGVGIITMNDPATMNAAGADVGEELRAAVAEMSAEGSGVRALVLTGAGRGFCSGANLAARGSGGMSMDSETALKTIYNPLVTTFRDCSLPFVTAVNGAAAGVGCSLALMGDLIVAAESAYFLQAFRRIGLVPDGGSTYLLPRMIGRARAMEMTLLGDKIPARTALEWGMINRCVPDEQLMDTALELAGQLANGPKSIAMIRQLMWRSLDTDWAEQLDDEARTQGQASRTEDFGEGVRAFLEKRPAQFQGR